jgi:hypothetical protein
MNRPGSEKNNGKPGFGLCPHCKEWRTITDGHGICRVCEGVEKHELSESQQVSTPTTAQAQAMTEAQPLTDNYHDPDDDLTAEDFERAEEACAYMATIDSLEATIDAQEACIADLKTSLRRQIARADEAEVRGHLKVATVSDPKLLEIADFMERERNESKATILQQQKQIQKAIDFITQGGHIGAGEDPVGFLVCSYQERNLEYQQQQKYIEALEKRTGCNHGPGLGAEIHGCGDNSLEIYGVITRIGKRLGVVE